MTPTQRQKEDLNFWNIIFSIFFMCVFVGALYVMQAVRGGFLVAVSPFDAFLMALATFRLTRLVVYDKITRWFRELFADTSEFVEGGVTYIEIKPFGSGFRHTIYDLLSCPWCIAIWSALIVMFCYFLFAWAWSVIFFLALAGVGSFFQLVANAVGWKAENLKLDSFEKEERIKRQIDLTSIGK